MPRRVRSISIAGGKWAHRMAGAWAKQFRGLLADITGRAAQSHGYPPRAVEAAEARLGVGLPGPLRDYYLSVGRHAINRAHNRLLPPDGITVSQGRLVFMEENQQVVFWGVQTRSRAADPVVFKTNDPEDGDWWLPEARCSQFLSAMMCWQAVGGGLPHGGCTDPVDSTVARRALRGWRLVGRMFDLSAFVRDGRTVCVVISEGEDALLHFAARSRRVFQSLGAELGVEVNCA
jgi:hypothetical protein